MQKQNEFLAFLPRGRVDKVRASVSGHNLRARCLVLQEALFTLAHEFSSGPQVKPCQHQLKQTFGMAAEKGKIAWLSSNELEPSLVVSSSSKENTKACRPELEAGNANSA